MVALDRMSAYIVAKDQNELEALNERDLYYDQASNKIYAIKKTTPQQQIIPPTIVSYSNNNNNNNNLQNQLPYIINNAIAETISLPKQQPVQIGQLPVYNQNYTNTSNSNVNYSNQKQNSGNMLYNNTIPNNNVNMNTTYSRPAENSNQVSYNANNTIYNPNNTPNYNNNTNGNGFLNGGTVFQNPIQIYQPPPGNDNNNNNNYLSQHIQQNSSTYMIPEVDESEHMKNVKGSSSSNKLGNKNDPANRSQIKYSESFERALRRTNPTSKQTSGKTLKSGESTPSDFKSNSTEYLIRSKQTKENAENSRKRESRSKSPASSKIPRPTTRQSSTASSLNSTEEKGWKVMHTSPVKSYSAIYKEKRGLSSIQDNTNEEEFYESNSRRMSEMTISNNLNAEINRSSTKKPKATSESSSHNNKHNEDYHDAKNTKKILELTNQMAPYSSKKNNDFEIDENGKIRINHMDDSPGPTLPLSENTATPNNVYYEVNKNEDKSQYEKPIQPIVLQPRLQQQIKFEPIDGEKPPKNKEEKSQMPQPKPSMPPREQSHINKQPVVEPLKLDGVNNSTTRTDKSYPAIIGGTASVAPKEMINKTQPTPSGPGQSQIANSQREEDKKSMNTVRIFLFC